MKKKNHKEPSHVINDVDMFAVSPTEMTGLFAAAPQEYAEIEAYKELYPFRADCASDPHEHHDDFTKKKN